MRTFSERHQARPPYVEQLAGAHMGPERGAGLIGLCGERCCVVTDEHPKPLPFGRMSDS